ncbi:MAG TPA: hypothetical protein GX505_09715 [Clostridiales bacterium]|nr:hypothetical protein [Clostridiales bacterium]
MRIKDVEAITGLSMKSIRLYEAPVCIGIDLGTTTISSVVICPETGKTYGVYTISNSTNITSARNEEKMQDAALLLERAGKLLDFLIDKFSPIAAIGVTGQMHGIVYSDAELNVLSPLYTWQDQRASTEYCKNLQRQTRYRVAPGYGLATHIFLSQISGLPRGSVYLSTIMDLFAARLCGLERLISHASNAASLGFFDLRRGCFETKVLEKCGVEPKILPVVTVENEVIGKYRDIPVAVAIGDNQASFLGAIKEQESSALANFGTGSQISLVTDDARDMANWGGEIEARPFIDGRYLLCGSVLCGGRAYAIIERFFRAYAVACGLPDSEQYEVLNRLAEKGVESGNVLKVRTTFSGTRNDSSVRGEITGIGEDNFTPEALAAGCLYGMAGELYEIFRKIGSLHIEKLVASGNAVRENRALRRALSEVFKIPVFIPQYGEEAARGAAIFAAAAKSGEPARDIAARCVTYECNNR